MGLSIILGVMAFVVAGFTEEEGGFVALLGRWFAGGLALAAIVSVFVTIFQIAR